MMKRLLPLLFLLTAAAAADMRSWMDKEGRLVHAEVVRVNPDRTVVLRNDAGKAFTVPFDTFMDIDVEHLEFLLARRGNSRIHPVPWYELNTLFGLEIWRDDLLWDDLTADLAERLRMRQESRTDFMENYRAYPLGRVKVLGEQVYAAALYGGESCTESLSLVFLNQGDAVPRPGGKTVAERIEAAGMNIHDTISEVLGRPKRDSIGNDDLREKVWRWDWNDHAVMLSIQEGRYVALRIMPVARAERGGRVEKIDDDSLKMRIASCIEQRDNGDVMIRNIPMVNQGPKGYCSPATWERYLRYLSIPADMYLLALAADTDAGGTYIGNIVAATRNIITANGRKLRDIDEVPTLENIPRHIDMGLPMMWRFQSTPEFQQTVNRHTAERNEVPGEEKNSDQREMTTAGGHICLIIGYNLATGEVAISDSWGPKFAERWVPIEEIQQVSYARGGMYVIRW